VEHDLSMMTVFAGFQKYPTSLKQKIMSWRTM
jgi:hypothetical protein